MAGLANLVTGTGVFGKKGSKIAKKLTPGSGLSLFGGNQEKDKNRKRVKRQQRRAPVIGGAADLLNDKLG